MEKHITQKSEILENIKIFYSIFIFLIFFAEYRPNANGTGLW